MCRGPAWSSKVHYHNQCLLWPGLTVHPASPVAKRPRAAWRSKVRAAEGAREEGGRQAVSTRKGASGQPGVACIWGDWVPCVQMGPPAEGAAVRCGLLEAASSARGGSTEAVAVGAGHPQTHGQWAMHVPVALLGGGAGYHEAARGSPANQRPILGPRQLEDPVVHAAAGGVGRGQLWGVVAGAAGATGAGRRRGRAGVGGREQQHQSGGGGAGTGNAGALLPCPANR